MNVLFALALLELLFNTAQARERNYLDPRAPIYQSQKSAPAAKQDCGVPQPRSAITAVSYNIEFSKKLPSIIRQLQHLDADIIFLQEVVGVPDSKSDHAAEKIASALNMHYAYAPAFIHPRNEQDFGVAVLSKYPVSDVSKIILPHVHFQAKTQRIALGATITPPCRSSVRVYSAHLETLQWSHWRIDQARAIVQDAASYSELPVLIAGDMNSAPAWQRWHLVKKFKDWGYNYQSRYVGRSMCKGPLCMKIDLVFARAARLDVIARLNERHSDHYPIFLQFDY